MNRNFHKEEIQIHKRQIKTCYCAAIGVAAREKQVGGEAGGGTHLCKEADTAEDIHVETLHA